MKKTLVLFLALVLALSACSFAAAEEKPTLKVLGTYVGFDPNNDPTATAIEERTGYHMEYYVLPSENGMENLLMQLSSGETYDILRIGGDMYQKLQSMNALLPLNDLLDQYGENLKTLITAEAYTLTTTDGTIYGIPMMTEKANIDDTIILRKDILDELGIAMPETRDEFTAMLEKVHEAHPEMVTFCPKDASFVGTITSSFGFYFDWNEEDGKLASRVELPEYKEYLGYMKELYEKGLIDPDLAINNSTTIAEKVASGNVFAWQSGWYDASTQVPALKENFPNVELLYMDPIKDAEGNRGISCAYALNNVTCIPASAPHAEDAVKMMNAKLDHDTFTYVTLGTEGETFYVDDEGYHPIMPIFTELRGNAWWYLNSFDMTRYGDMWMARTRRNAALGEAFDALNANFDEMARYSPVALTPSLDAVNEYSSSLTTLIKDYALQVLVGVKNLDEYDGFVSEWKANGGDAMSEAYNTWFANK